MLVYISQGIVLGLYAAVMPGPLQAFYLSESLRSGWKRTLPAAFAPLISDLPVLLTILLLLSQVPDRFLNLLRLGGGLYLLYLAWGTFQNARSGILAAEADDKQPRSLIKAGLLNLLNPNVYIFWGTIGAPLVLDGMKQTAWHGLSFILAFYLVMIPSAGMLIYLFGTLGKLNERVQRGILYALTLLMLGMGGFQITLGVMGLG